MVTINLLTGKRTANPVEVDARDFWRMYLRLLNAKTHGLTAKEIDIVSLIASLDENINYFSAPHTKEVIANVKCTAQEMSKMKKKFISLGILNENGALSNTMRIIKDLASKDSIAFIFPMVIK